MELGRLRRQGQDLDEFIDEPVVSFTGDTRIEFLDDETVRRSRVLIMEVTYWDKKKSVENAREWGHIHFDELLPRLESIKSEKILLIHASARYSTAELKKILDERLPEHFKHRVELFPRP
jgi:ribonuclease Z